MAKLKPKKFKQATTVLKSPIKTKENKKGMKIPVHVSPENGGYITRWNLSFWDRVLLLLNPRRSIWLVVYGKSHPPVYLTCKNTVFDKEKEY